MQNVGEVARVADMWLLTRLTQHCEAFLLESESILISCSSFSKHFVAAVDMDHMPAIASLCETFHFKRVRAALIEHILDEFDRSELRE